MRIILTSIHLLNRGVRGALDLKTYHDQWLSYQRCAVVGCKCSPIGHHLRGKGLGEGIGLKPHFLFRTPLCDRHHKELHDRGLYTFEKKYALDLAQVLAHCLKGFIEWYERKVREDTPGNSSEMSEPGETFAPR